MWLFLEHSWCKLWHYHQRLWRHDSFVYVLINVVTSHHDDLFFFSKTLVQSIPVSSNYYLCERLIQRHASSISTLMKFWNDYFLNKSSFIMNIIVINSTFSQLVGSTWSFFHLNRILRPTFGEMGISLSSLLLTLHYEAGPLSGKNTFVLDLSQHTWLFVISVSLKRKMKNDGNLLLLTYELLLICMNSLWSWFMHQLWTLPPPLKYCVQSRNNAILSSWSEKYKLIIIYFFIVNTPSTVLKCVQFEMVTCWINVICFIILYSLTRIEVVSA
jgi:hypothetical protein